MTGWFSFIFYTILHASKAIAAPLVRRCIHGDHTYACNISFPNQSGNCTKSYTLENTAGLLLPTIESSDSFRTCIETSVSESTIEDGPFCEEFHEKSEEYIKVFGCGTNHEGNHEESQEANDEMSHVKSNELCKTMFLESLCLMARIDKDKSGSISDDFELSAAILEKLEPVRYPEDEMMADLFDL